MAELTFYNTSNQLTFSADGTTYSYIGKATRSQLLQPQGTINTQMTNGYSIYTIAWAGDILVTMPLNSAGTCGFIDQTQSNGVWTIKVHNGDGTKNPYGFEGEAYTDVFVFGAPTWSTIAGSTFVAYSADGLKPVADLMRQPLTYKGILTMGAGVTSVTPPATTNIGIIGNPPDSYSTYVTDQTTKYVATYFTNSWHLNTGTGKVERLPYAFQALYSNTDNHTLATYNAVTALYIDLTGLT